MQKNFISQFSTHNSQLRYFSILHSQLSTRKGFTLIELLVVIGIIGIVATALFIGVNPVAQLQKANDANRKSDLATMQRALQLYYEDNGSYPASSGNFKLFISSATLNWGSPWQPYISVLPEDPTASREYVYYSPASSNGQTYYLYASLERGEEDKEACNEGNPCSSLSQGGAGFPSANACGETCNFGLTSPNVSP